MKKIGRLSMILGLCVGLASCGKDDEGLSAPENTLVFEGVEYALSVGDSYLVDYGCIGNYCNYDFYLAGTDEGVEVYLELYQKTNEENFSGGSFKPLNIKGNYFKDDLLTIDGVDYTPKAGRVIAKKLSGANEWSITFKYDYPGGYSAKGNVTGTFAYTQD